MIQGIHHFEVIVSDEESVAFYEKLGFKEFFRREREHDVVVLLRGYGVQIELFIDPNHPPRSIQPENLGLRRLALKVDDIEKTVQALGLKIGKITNDWLGSRFAFITDPDGVPIELHE